MYLQVRAVALVVLVALGSLGLAAAKESKEAAGETKDPPKELTLDLGKGVKLELVRIPAGEFMMGSPDADKAASDVEKPRHRVRISKPFYLGKYMVTQEQWEAVMGNHPSNFQGPKNPVEQVSWDDCQQFLGKLNARFSRQPQAPLPDEGKFRLPSEAQWEYACRAGSTTQFYFGDDEKQLGQYAWYGENSGRKTHPVGEKKPNAWGLYDMHGNVWEWCQDWHDGGYYAKSPADDPTGPATGSDRVIRGGSWSLVAALCRSSCRFFYPPGFRFSRVGFRVARMPDK
jgi:formylglycine-generating enzyme required for sulfatase activity